MNFGRITVPVPKLPPPSLPGAKIAATAGSHSIKKCISVNKPKGVKGEAESKHARHAKLKNLDGKRGANPGRKILSAIWYDLVRFDSTFPVHPRRAGQPAAVGLAPLGWLAG